MKLCVHPSDLAPGLMLGHDVELGEDLELGAWVVIHSGTVVGDGCEVQDGAVLGKRPRLGPRSTAPRESLEPLRIGAGAVVCAGAVVYAGAELSEGAVVGDQAQLRERSRVGPASVIGRGCGVDNDVEIGARVRVQSNCYLAAHAVIEDDAFVAPGVVTTNDDSMGRRGPDQPMRGPRIGRAARVGAGAVLRPGISIGEEAFVAAGAVVVADVEPRAVVMGVPARAVREVPVADLLG
jgi:UDP-2-acetamido-3-amino-2,3-dideoxy-glucuronate N-acetyltransferase